MDSIHLAAIQFTEVSCFQQVSKLRMHIRQLGKQTSYSTEVWFVDNKLPSFAVKNVYNIKMSWKLCWRHGVSIGVFCQVGLLSA